jgi:hypothetical protein
MENLLCFELGFVGELKCYGPNLGRILDSIRRAFDQLCCSGNEAFHIQIDSQVISLMLRPVEQTFTPFQPRA